MTSLTVVASSLKPLCLNVSFMLHFPSLGSPEWKCSANKVYSRIFATQDSNALGPIVLYPLQILLSNCLPVQT